LAENQLKPWRQDMWCIPQVDGEYVTRMEDVLDLYAEASDPKRPVVGFDESPTQLIGEVRQPIPAEPGQRRRYDYEYQRNGTVNLFVFLDAHRPWRKVKVTDSVRGYQYPVSWPSPEGCSAVSSSSSNRNSRQSSCRASIRPAGHSGPGLRKVRDYSGSGGRNSPMCDDQTHHYVYWLNRLENLEIGPALCVKVNIK
jgi:DDE superfamily endonuclease